MSRPRATPESAKADLIREIRVRRAEIDLTQNQLADEIGVCPSVMSVLLKDPDKISMGRLRAIVRVLSPDPVVVLTALGYTNKDIQKLKRAPSDS